MDKITDGICEFSIRVLWVDPKGYCYTINLKAKKLDEITKISFADIETKLIHGEFRKNSMNPYLVFDYGYPISASMKSKRDKAYDSAMYVIDKVGEPFVFEKSAERSKAVGQASYIHGLSIPTIYHYLLTLFKGCRIKDSLLPQYFKCGNKESRINYQKRPGRKNRNGINYILTKIDIENFEDILKAQTSPYKEMNLSKAYDPLLNKHYTKAIDGIAVKAIKANRPTYEQFRNFAQSKNKKDEVIRVKGKKAFDLNNRPLYGSTVDHVAGGASCYEVDSTQLDIYVVNTLTYKYIGPIEFYAGIEPTSKEVGGIALEVEGESLNGYKQLMYNFHADKVEFVKAYGFDIEPSQWPARGLPSKVLADKGKMAQPSLDETFDNLHVVCEHAATGRGDLKPNIERFFRFINDNLKAYLLGGKVHAHERCQPDDREQAIYTFDEIMIALIALTLQYNSRFMDDYPASREMIRDAVVLSPNALYEYGVVHQSGSMTILPNNVLIYHLLKKETVSVQRDGIHFLNSRYVNPSLMSEWMSKATLGEGVKVKIAYDSSDLSFIYVITNTGEYVRCDMIPSDAIRYGCHLTERDLIEADEQKSKESADYKLYDKANLERYNKFNDITSDALKRDTPPKDFKNVKPTREEEAKRQKKANALIRKIDEPKENNESAQNEIVENSEPSIYDMY
jgi:hypothetical protein